MEEKTLWRGSSAPIINLGTYTLCFVAAGGIAVLLCLVLPGVPRFVWLAAVLPIVFALSRHLANRCRVYEVTTERGRVSELE